MSFEVRTAVIEQPGEIVGMIQMPARTVITAWGHDAQDRGGYIHGHIHGTQCDFPLGTDQETIWNKVFSLYEAQARAFLKIDKEWKEKHG